VRTELPAQQAALPDKAQQRVQAVRSIWTERRRPAEVCQELAISPKGRSHWEERALEARTRREPGAALSPKLERLVARQAVQQKGRMAKLEKWLAKLQEPKAPPPAK
jgi:hypothetical protein